MIYERRKSRQVDVGGVKIGGEAPVVLQSMTNTLTTDIAASVQQIANLRAAGCDLIRIAVPDDESAECFKLIREEAGIPLIADIHFNYRLALKAIEYGADKIRINPGNIGSFDRVKKILEAAGKKNIPVRVGVNSGSLEKSLHRKKGVSTESLLESAMNQVHQIEKEGFRDIVIASKGSSVMQTIEVNRLLAKETDYPLHLGLTEAGLPGAGSVKSAVAIGTLLAEGIGDTIRISLTGDPLNEIRDGLTILRALGLRPPGFELIACPTCARTHGAVEETARIIEAEFGKIDKPVKVAVMGCEVNGPGEAKEADIGVAFAKKGGAMIMRKGRIVARTDNVLAALRREIANIFD